MSQVKIAAVWKFNRKETELRFGKTAGGIICVVSECGKYWFGSIDTGTFTCGVGKIFGSLSVCFMDEMQSGAWESVRQAILNDTIGPPTEGKSPYSKKHEEECNTCRRIKDTGSKCWWCGNE